MHLQLTNTTQTQTSISSSTLFTETIINIIGGHWLFQNGLNK